MKYIKFSVLMILGLVLLTSNSFATQQRTPAEASAAAERTRASIGTKSIYTDYMSGDLNEDEHGDGYIKPTYERLSQLYWALAMLDLKDDQAIDGYLKLHECDLYKQFYARDFELNELRKVARESIEHNLDSFPTKFEIFMPVGLERYDIANKEFQISDGSQFVESKKLEVSRNELSRRICGESDIPQYPRNFILYFNRPFSLKAIPMSPGTAQEIIDFADEENKKLGKGKNVEFKHYSSMGRIVFLRLKVTLSQYKEMQDNYSDLSVPVIFATIDGYQIYFDQERTHLIYDQEIETTRKLERLKDVSDRKEFSMPEGPLLKQGDVEETTTVP